jgi:hypothetical protein
MDMDMTNAPITAKAKAIANPFRGGVSDGRD